MENKKLIIFFIKVYKKTKENELLVMANALTYKLVIALFPFIIFIMTLLGFFNINVNNILANIKFSIPSEIGNIVNLFLEEVFYNKNLTLLSSSLIMSIIHASSGFRSIIRGLNRAYEQKETRGFVKLRIISLLLVFAFTTIILLSLILFIFKDIVKNALVYFGIVNYITFIIDNTFLYALSAFMLFIIVIVIYRISLVKKIKLIHLTPGAIFTSVLWLIISKLFNIYINNFSRFSKIYGSIGGIFILLFWINMISFIFLLGGQINAIIFESKNKDKYNFY